VVLAAAIVSATGAFAKAPAHPSAVTAPTTTTPAPDVAPPATLSKPAAEPATEPAETAEPAGTETDAAGGHADDPNDPNADHQFDGEE
jgi:hypothetical protein